MRLTSGGCPRGLKSGNEARVANRPRWPIVFNPRLAPSAKSTPSVKFLFLNREEILDLLIVEMEAFMVDLDVREVETNAPWSLMYPFVKRLLKALLIRFHFLALVILGGGSDLIVLCRYYVDIM